jgi:hypothetical protein
LLAVPWQRSGLKDEFLDSPKLERLKIELSPSPLLCPQTGLGSHIITSGSIVMDLIPEKYGELIPAIWCGNEVLTGKLL